MLVNGIWTQTRTRSVFLLAVLALTLSAPAAQAAPVQIPGGITIEKVDFERHLMGVFGRMGCNLGSCHGSFQGKGGFRLSLFGYDPSMDYHALTRDAQGRRLNVTSPDESLLLIKATGQVPHEGNVRFGKNTWAYQLFVEWIKQGAQRTPGSGEVVNIAVTPSELALKKPGDKAKIQIWATFKDGSKENITPFCDFRTNDETVAEVSNLGEVSTRLPGDTSLVVIYRGAVLPVRVLVPLEARAGYPKIPEVNYVDREVFAKLRRLNIVPSDLASDAEFLRRVTIDTIGSLPTPEDIRAFLADNSPNKREKKIDQLLAHPMHAALWATKFSDITGNNTDALENPAQQKTKLSQAWHEWLRKRVADNMPYDEIVKNILTATTREGRKPEEWMTEVRTLNEQFEKGFQSDYPKRQTLDIYWRRQQVVPIDQWGQKTAAAFLGVRIECAECHKHPFDRWTQTDYRSYANIFAGVTVGVSPEAKKAIDDENAARKAAAGNVPQNRQPVPIRELFVSTPRALMTHPETAAALAPKALGGPELKLAAGQTDLRVALFDWMRQSDNPFFARSFANRVWGHYFGRGIVDPVDDFSLANPPSNPALLDALARDFVESKYNIRQLEKTILMSRTYQLGSATNETNKHDKINYARSYVRPMMAEVVVDVINSALDIPEVFGTDTPSGVRATEVGSSRLTNANVAYAFRIFGRPPRTTACDCERTMEPGLVQKLYLMADQAIERKLNDPQNRIKRIVTTIKDDDKAFEELVLALVSRMPTDAERELFRKHLAKTPDRLKAYTNAAWAFLNTAEFISNH